MKRRPTMAESRRTEPPAPVPFAAHKIEAGEEAGTYLSRVRRALDRERQLLAVPCVATLG